MTIVHEKIWDELGLVLLSDSISVESAIDMQVPISLVGWALLHKSSNQSLVSPLIQPICLGVVGTTDSVLYICELEQSPWDFIHKFSTLIRQDCDT